MRKTLFGDIITADGYKVQFYGRNTIRLQNGRTKYFVFVEPLADPKSYQVDMSGVWLDAQFKRRLDDENIVRDMLQKAMAYLSFRSIRYEISG